MEYFITCAEAAKKIEGNAKSFTARLNSLRGYKASSNPKIITTSSGFLTRMHNYDVVGSSMSGLPGSITANCASYPEKKLKKEVASSDADVRNINRYEAKVAKAK